MSVEQAIFEHVTGTTAVSDLISTRLYAVLAPPDVTYPHAVYLRISSEHVESLAGGSGLAKTAFMIIAYARTPLGAVALAEEILIAMYAMAVTLGGTRVHGGRPVSEDMVFEEEVNAYRFSREFDVWHEEKVA